jgi:hypothetical protein
MVPAAPAAPNAGGLAKRTLSGLCPASTGSLPATGHFLNSMMRMRNLSVNGREADGFRQAQVTPSPRADLDQDRHRNSYLDRGRRQRVGLAPARRETGRLTASLLLAALCTLRSFPDSVSGSAGPICGGPRCTFLDPSGLRRRLARNQPTTPERPQAPRSP